MGQLNLHLGTSEIYVPDRGPCIDDEIEALRHATHIAIGAHQDDIEIMAFHGIRECFGKDEKKFVGVTVTDGAGSPRDGIYADYSDEQMKAVRWEEQMKAAVVGDYAMQVILGYPSKGVKDPRCGWVIEDLAEVLRHAQPEVIYTHCLTDKHPTHVAVAIRVIEALRKLVEQCHPVEFYGCEVWRDLDWLPDEIKVALNVSGDESLQAALLGVYHSQIAGGKRYDLATLGRRRAHATYHESHGVDATTGLTFAMDMKPLILPGAPDIKSYVADIITQFNTETAGVISSLL